MSKVGIKYITMETDRYLDVKIKRLKKSFSGNGVAIHDYILSEIYRDKGCFIQWDENTVFDVAEYWGVKESLVEEIVNYCCHVGLFDKGLLTSESVLTSAAIQQRFIKWSILMKRKNPKVPEKYNLIHEEHAKIQEELPKVPVVLDVKGSNVKESNSEVTILHPNFDLIFGFFKENSKWDDDFCIQKTKLFIAEYSQKLKSPDFDWGAKANKWILTERLPDKSTAKKKPISLPDHWSVAFYTTNQRNKPVIDAYFNSLINAGYYQTIDNSGFICFKKPGP